MRCVSHWEILPLDCQITALWQSNDWRASRRNFLIPHINRGTAVLWTTSSSRAMLAAFQMMNYDVMMACCGICLIMVFCTPGRRNLVLFWMRQHALREHQSMTLCCQDQISPTIWLVFCYALDRNSVIYTTSMKKEANDIVTRILTWFSDWFRLWRFVALFHRTAKCFQHVLLRTSTLPDPRTVSLCVSNLLQADKIIVRWVQNRSFPEEISCLQSGEDSFLPQSNRLAPLSPILVDGILRVGSRIKNAPVTDYTKHPVILPADSPVSPLIIQKIHIETGHGGRDQVLSRLCQRYWVIHATSVCRQICKYCVSCRRHCGRTVQQQMADLPTDRVTPDQPPFTSIGVDFFGSIQVKRGQS